MALLSKEKKFKIVGVDVFVFHPDGLPEFKEDFGNCELKVISNRGTKVWPGAKTLPHLSDVHQCRFKAKKSLTLDDVTKVLSSIEKQGYDWVHVEKLMEIDGKAAYAKSSGE